jgi:hypothetical protein
MILSKLITVSGLFSVLVHSAPAHNKTGVSPPKTGLDSNSNYIFVDKDGSNILNLVAQVFFNTDFHVSSTGASFQLNCWSPTPQKSSDLALQQFVIGFHDREFDGVINTWTVPDPSDPRSEPQPDFITGAKLTSAKNNNVIPAGTTLTITLDNDHDGTVTAAGFSVTIGGTKSSGSIAIQEGTASIDGFTFAIVGDGDGSQGQFSGGNGTLTYSATNAFGPVNALPDGFLSLFTVETGNSLYGELPSSPGTTLKQSFSVSS